jgi:hypothetical protein
MAEYVYADLVPRTYPEGRDAQDRPVGTVEPGDIRDLEEAPDYFWRLATGEDRAAREQALAGPAADGSGDGTETGDPSGQDGEPAPDGSQPAPPAIIPGA